MLYRTLGSSGARPAQPRLRRRPEQRRLPVHDRKTYHHRRSSGARAQISYVGELGWEIYAPSELGLHLWDTLWDAGQSLGVIAGGGGAFDSLRLEKGYRLWGNDIHTEYNPYEAGIGFTVRMRKGDFIGREALREVRASGPSRKLCCMTLDDPAAVVMGKEPILEGDRVLGYVTSANYGQFDRTRDRVRLSACGVRRGRDGRRCALLRRTSSGNGRARAAV